MERLMILIKWQNNRKNRIDSVAERGENEKPKTNIACDLIEGWRDSVRRKTERTVWIFREVLKKTIIAKNN